MDAELKIEYWDIELLTKYKNNTKTHPDSQVDKIANSIKSYGFDQPIAVDTEGVIIKGHGRLMAALKLGMKKVPVIVRADLTLIQAAASRIADNKVAESPWDESLLPLELEMLKESGINIDEDIGFSAEEIANIFKDAQSISESNELDDEIPEMPYTPVSKLGDVWILGNHRLMCGDSTMVDNVDRLMNGDTCLLMLTDPPYGVKLDQSWRDEALGDKALGKGNNKLIQNDDRADWTDAYSLFNGSIAYVWHATSQTDVVKKNLEDCNLITRQMIIWNKSIMVMGRGAYHWKHEPCWYAVKKGCDANWKGDRKQTTVWDAASPNHIMSGSKEDKTEHPSQKPVVLFETPILNHTAHQDSIYDPFGGSGSTLIACEKTNRKCFMMELSPSYVDLIVKRWEKFSGMKARLESTGQEFKEVANE